MERIFAQATKRVNPKILALAQNYIPPGQKDVPAKPLIFTKPHSSILYKGENLIINSKNQVNYEIELGVMIGKAGKNIAKQQAFDYIGGYFLCLDMTDWDMQTANRKNGFPWDLGKGQDGFLPISDFIEKKDIKDPHNINLKLQINQKNEVDGNTKNMFFKIDDIIQYVSQYMTLNPGDLILTGTPKLAPVENGDKLFATLHQDGRQMAEINVDVLRKI
ncbi:hypothetical protein ABPG74_021321 [Tetrahymena malaccensis]